MNQIRVALYAMSLLLVSGLSVAQITIGPEDAPAIGSTYVSTHAGEIVFDPLAPGGNRNWDISDYTYTNEGWQNWIAPADAPGHDVFPTATVVLANGDESESSYSYLRVASNGAYSLGTAAFVEGELYAIPYDNEALTIPFPLSFGAQWTTVTRLTFELVPGFTQVQLDSTVHNVDAWGTMTTASWSGGALRDLQHEFTASYLNGQLQGSDEEWNYFWWGEEVGNSVHYSCDGICDSPNFVNGDLSVNSATTTASEPVRGPVADNFSVGQNYPNPFNPTTTLPITVEQATKVEVTIYNELGEVVSHEAHHFGPGEHVIPFDGSQWSSGSYFAQVTAGNLSQTKRMTLVK